MTVSSTTSLDDALLVTGFPYNVREERREAVALFNAFLGEAQAVRRLGSAALDLCYLACGRIDGYWETKIHPWDVAAGSLIVHEAGGRTSGLDGAAFGVFGGQVLASNGVLHGDMLEVIKRVRSDMPV
jgi:myo-inositol-1(or 4)-monophosphatase